jgi:uncharacterized protein YigE (DUF2233 family)
MALAGLALLLQSASCTRSALDLEHYVAIIADPKSQHIDMALKDEHNENLGSLKKYIDHLKSKNQQVVFAMNGGMYHASREPVGLYIENYRKVAPLNTDQGSGNFFLQPNGVFYLTDDHRAHIVSTTAYRDSSNIRCATQSGPMLVIDGNIHPVFQPKSTNVNIRNGIGLLSDGRLLMAMSKEKVNLYTFAEYFKKQGCANALYLDGAVSRAYCPEQNWQQLDGEFGVMIAVTTRP